MSCTMSHPFSVLSLCCTCQSRKLTLCRAVPEVFKIVLEIIHMACTIVHILSLTTTARIPMYQKSIAHVQGVSKQLPAIMESLRIISELLYFTLKRCTQQKQKGYFNSCMVISATASLIHKMCSCTAKRRVVLTQFVYLSLIPLLHH